MTVYADTRHDDTELRAWAYLSAVAEPPCTAIRRLVDDVGAAAAADAIRTRRVPAGHEAVLGPTIARADKCTPCLLYTSPSPRDGLLSRMPSSA